MKEWEKGYVMALNGNRTAHPGVQAAMAECGHPKFKNPSSTLKIRFMAAYQKWEAWEKRKVMGLDEQQNETKDLLRCPQCGKVCGIGDVHTCSPEYRAVYKPNINLQDGE